MPPSLLPKFRSQNGSDKATQVENVELLKVKITKASDADEPLVFERKTEKLQELSRGQARDKHVHSSLKKNPSYLSFIAEE